jgi:NADPH:quinone reductase-like Zn-dependent oxidoreductase
VSGAIRSQRHFHRLAQQGVYPVLESDRLMLEQVSHHADRVFDAVGGGLANAILSVLPERAELVSYGLLSGQALSQTRATPGCINFICVRRWPRFQPPRGRRHFAKSGRCCRQRSCRQRK